MKVLDTAGILESGDVLEHLSEAARKLGFVGDTKNVELLYVIMTSRLTEAPVSGLVKARPGSGKSEAVNVCGKLMPPNALHKLTSFSPKALVWTERNLSHIVLSVEEVAGVPLEAVPMLRGLLSGGRIEYEVAKSGGTELIVREGPTSLIMTTASDNIDPESEDRMLQIPVKLTGDAITDIYKSFDNPPVKLQSIQEPWHDLQARLQTEDPAVFMPFWNCFSELMPRSDGRLLRAVRMVRSLVQTHALLNHRNRKRSSKGRIIATVSDYARVRRLAGGYISQTAGLSTPPTIRETVSAVDALAKRESSVSLSALADYLKIDKSNASRRVEEAVDLQYLTKKGNGLGRRVELGVGDRKLESANILPHPNRIREKIADRK